eukprot:586551-Alexandrium_andersonii.AAC.1
MSPAEPSRWLRAHSVCRKGKGITRQEGGKVGALAEPWRRLPADYPDYFEDGKARNWFSRRRLRTRVFAAGFLTSTPKHPSRQWRKSICSQANIQRRRGSATS